MSDKEILGRIYVITSQGIPIMATPDKEVAVNHAIENNIKWLRYKQYCLDHGEAWVDNQEFVFEEVFYGNGTKEVKEVELKWFGVSE